MIFIQWETCLALHMPAMHLTSGVGDWDAIAIGHPNEAPWSFCSASHADGESLRALGSK